MLVSALVDLGVPIAVIEDGLSTLGVTGYRLEFGHAMRHSIAGRTLTVHIEGKQPQRDYRSIVELLEATDGLGDGAKARALRTFRVLAEAEAEVHGVPIDDVHFHEVGAVDSIVDTVGACIALDHLGAEVRASPLPLARGFTRSQHGRIPLPAPATALCLRGVPTTPAGIDKELVTPTGAALVRANCSVFEAWPNLVIERIGYGAGGRDLEDRPNLLRAVLGTEDAKDIKHSKPGGREAFAILEANLDDMSGELAGHALQAALEHGALDSWYVPIGMKKGRPAVMLCALVREAQIDEVARSLLAETTTLGIRVRPCDRIERPRRVVTVDTAFGPVKVKVADGDGLPPNVAPEYESCKQAAATYGASVKQVFSAAIAAFEQTGPRR